MVDGQAGFMQYRIKILIMEISQEGQGIFKQAGHEIVSSCDLGERELVIEYIWGDFSVIKESRIMMEKIRISPTDNEKWKNYYEMCQKDYTKKRFFQ